MDDQTGLQLFDRALQLNAVNPMTARLDLAALRTTTRERSQVPPLLRSLVLPKRRAAHDGSPSRSDAKPLSRRLAGMAASNRTAALLSIIWLHTATVLGHTDPEAVKGDRPFKELGIDSLAAVELRNRLCAETGMRLPPTVVFDHPSSRQLADHLANLIEPGRESARAIDTATVLTHTAAGPVITEEQIDDMDIGDLVAMVNTKSTGLQEESE
jgi:acyl carrier protein